MSQEEIKAQGWSTTDLCFDSRRLLHYVRLLPDGRFMFGGRGGWDASEKGKTRMRAYMERTFKEMLPAWADVEFTYFWNGFICLSYDLVAHISNPQGMTLSGAHWPGLAKQRRCCRYGRWKAGREPGKGGSHCTSRHSPGHAFATAEISVSVPATKYLRAAYTLYRIKDEYL